MNIADQIVGAESGGNYAATNPRSTALGGGQFINSTWLAMMRRYRPDLTQGRSDGQILALRTDPALSREMTGRYADENTATLTGAGFQASPGNVYLAHFAGPAGAVKVLGSPNASAAETLGPAVVTANPFLANMTNGQLAAWATRRMGAQNVPRPPADIPNVQQPGMLADADIGLSASTPSGMLDGRVSGASMGAPLALAGQGSAAPSMPMASAAIAPAGLQAAALGLPGAQAPQGGFSLANLFRPPTTPDEQAAWFARQNPTG